MNKAIKYGIEGDISSKKWDHQAEFLFRNGWHEA